MGGYAIPGPLCNTSPKPRRLEDGTMCRCASRLPGPVGTEPSMWDHWTGGKPAPDYLGNERWFEERYPNLLEHARTVFIQNVSDWLAYHWGEDEYDGSNLKRIVVIGRNIYENLAEANQKEISRRRFLAPKHFLRDNQFEACGDQPQTFHEADAVVGRFGIDMVTPVKITYTKKAVGDETVEGYVWSTEMYVADVMGLQPEDKIGTGGIKNFFLDNVPTRRVKRAKWQIGASGEKDD